MMRTAQHSTAQHSTAQHSILYLKTGERSGFFRHFARFFLLLLACLSATAQAALTCQVQSNQMVQGHATTFITPSDNLPIGSAIGSWNLHQFWFTCQATAGSDRWGGMEQAVSATLTPVIWNATAASYNMPVYTTPELEPLGVGYSMSWYIVDDNLGHAGPSRVWRNADSQPDIGIINDYTTRSLSADDYNKNLHLGIVGSFRLVKISDAFNPNIGAGAIATGPIRLAGFTLRDQTGTPAGSTAYITIASPTITFAKRTCATPSWPTIRLPTITPADLPFVGAEGPAREFNLTMNCPTFLGEIGYYFSATNGFHDESQGIIRISPGSQAQGIGLKLQTRMRPHPVYLLGGGGSVPSPDYAPFRFGPTNRYALYNYPIRGGSPTENPLTRTGNFEMSWWVTPIPMKVSVVRTGDVVPGTYNASIIVVFVYR